MTQHAIRPKVGRMPKLPPAAPTAPVTEAVRADSTPAPKPYVREAAKAVVFKDKSERWYEPRTVTALGMVASVVALGIAFMIPVPDPSLGPVQAASPKRMGSLSPSAGGGFTAISPANAEGAPLLNIQQGHETLVGQLAPSGDMPKTAAAPAAPDAKNSGTPAIDNVDERKLLSIISKD